MSIVHEKDLMSSDRILRVSIDEFPSVAKALSSDLRFEMFKLLLSRPMNVAEIAEALNLPMSTAAGNIKKLESCGLIRTDLVPGTRGTQKICMAVISGISVDFHGQAAAEELISISMPIGHFIDCQVAPSCGLVSEVGIIGEVDEPRSFYEPNRTSAQLIWFRKGYVEYRFPNRLPYGSKLKSLEISMEVCSEAPLSNPDWPSDITLWIDDNEVGTWTCPGDFGQERGYLTPAWWPVGSTQYGLLKTWRVTEGGSFIDGRPISTTTLANVDPRSPFISVRIGVKPDAKNDGGINLFGSKFGNYETDIVLRMDYTD